MSSAEAISAIQLLGVCASITEAIIDIGRAAKNAKGLPPELQKLFETLPAIYYHLRIAQGKCETGDIAEERLQIAPYVLQQAIQALDELMNILREACPKDKENGARRLWTGSKTIFFGRQSKAQELLKTLQENLKLLGQMELYVFGDEFDALQDISESLLEDGDSKYTHSGSGHVLADKGSHPPINAGFRLPPFTTGNGRSTSQSLYDTDYATDWETKETQKLQKKRDEFMRALYRHGVLYREAKDSHERRVDGTCQWFIKHDIFERWLSATTNRESVLLVTAGPARGKSVLARYLIDEVLPCEDRVICYFFFDYKSNDQNSCLRVICTLLHQLLSTKSRLTQQIQEEFNDQGERFFESFANLWRIFVHAASQQDTICVFDALDVCEATEMGKLADAVLSLWKESPHRSSKGSVKCLLTSRPYDLILRQMHVLTYKVPLIQLEGELKESPDEMEEVGRLSANVTTLIEETSNLLQLRKAHTSEEILHDEWIDDDGASVQSIESSTTLVSSFSGLTMIEQSATVELEAIFQEDVDLISLYRVALKDASMGPDRLQRNVTRLIQIFAKDLHREASESLEKMASRFVRSKSQYIAQCIVENFADPSGITDPDLNANESHHDYGNRSEIRREPESFESDIEGYRNQSDDVDEIAPVDEDHFEDLPKLRHFLTQSSAFQLFRYRLTRFVLPNVPDQVDTLSTVNEHSAHEETSLLNRLLVSTTRISRTILVRFGCLEPPLQPGSVRLRWQCICGDPVFEDVQEYRIGNVFRLVEQIEQCSRGKVAVVAYAEGSSQQQYIPGPLIWLRDTVKDISRAISRVTHSDDVLPRYSDSTPAIVPASEEPSIPLERNLLLLACMNQERGGQYLRQDNLGVIETDRTLFEFVREQLSRSPTIGSPFWILRKITGIHFTQFHLRLNDDVEPRLHKLCCRSDSCQCIPQRWNSEYDCTPYGPLDYGPPVLPSKMIHYFKHPELIAEKEKSIFNQLPKRNCGKLEANGEIPAEGWGLYYERSWNFGLIIAILVVATILSSLLFGICWTVIRTDIQGAWGVSSYMVTTCALVVALLGIMSRSDLV